MMKPFSPACERNQFAILSQLEHLFNGTKDILEIGSGTGQHGAFFSQEKEGWTWQPTDIAANLPGIELWRQDTGLPNFKKALLLELQENQAIGLEKVARKYDGVFSANVLHIISEQLIGSFFKTAEHCLKERGILCIYGPFNYGGEFTSESNERFESWLKAKGMECGIRDIEFVIDKARSNSLELTDDIEMPANNRLLLFKK